LRNLVYLPVQLIKDAEEEGWLRSLAYFVRLKSLYWNNTHYNFSSRSLSSKLKCYPATLLFHLKTLEQKGIIRYHSNNISFIGLKKLQDSYGRKNIGVPVDNINQLDILRCQLIRFNLSAQEYKIKQSGLHHCSVQGFIPYRTSNKEKIKNNYTGLSAKGTGKLFGLSMSSGSRIRGKLSKLGFLKYDRIYSVLFQNVPPNQFKNLRNNFDIPAHSFLLNGTVYVERTPMLKYSI
jgi:hypothetical protein